jgi:GT2 family glycosyltransferase
VRQVSAKSSGVAASNNLGIRRTVGDFILFLGPGEILLPDALQLGLETLRDHPEAAIVLGHGPSTTECLSSGSIVLFRRSVFESVGVFRPGGKSAANLIARITEIFPSYCHHDVISGE